MKHWMMTTALTTFMAFASANAAEETLLASNSKIEHGGFGAISVTGTRVDGYSRYMVGGEGAWIINHSFFLGGAGYGLTMGVETNILDTNGAKQYLQMGYGGILLGTTFNSDRMVHFGVQSIIGAGGYMFSDDKWDETGDAMDHQGRGQGNMHEESFFVMEPQANAELNITKFMRVKAGIGYRFTWLPSEKNGYEGNDLGGICGSLALKFGKF
jgi:hypothetical protein